MRELRASREPVNGMLAAVAERAGESSSVCVRVRSARRVERRMDLGSRTEILVGVAIVVGVAGVVGGEDTSAEEMSAVEAAAVVATAKGDGAVVGGSEAPRNAQPLARSQTLQRRSTTRYQ